MAECRNIWNESMTLTLLDVYENNEFLWNAFHPNYTNKQKREEAYSSIIGALDSGTITLKDVKIKLKNLRSSYSGELKKIRDSRLSGEKEYAPKVFWFSKMDGFLRDVVVPQNSNFNEYLPAMIKEEFGPNDPIASMPLCSKLVTKKRRHARDNTRLADERMKQIKKEEQPEEIMIEGQVVEEDHNRLPKYRDDEFDAFGRNIALQLKTLPLDIALQMQIKMQTMLAEVRLSFAGHHRLDYVGNGSHLMYSEIDITNQSDEREVS